jgi:hypothetical protein
MAFHEHREEDTMLGIVSVEPSPIVVLLGPGQVVVTRREQTSESPW